MKIVIWTGPAWETWGPESLLTGIGGSEAAAIHLSAELAALGHEVEVLGQVTPCTYRGVTYTGIGQRPVSSTDNLADFLSSLPERVDCDVFVSSRQPQVLALLGDRLRARRKVLWMHDVHCGPDPGDLVGQYDEVFCLSRWALETMKKHYPRVPPNKFWQTRNGVDSSLYFDVEGPKKTGCRVVYSSSPDRGLDKLLDYWPTIRDMQGDAELHVYYGFDTWVKVAKRRGDMLGLMKIDIIRRRLDALSDQGVVWHGRAGQQMVARAYMNAAMWLYPTEFCETSCITAMEAQSAGCDVVCTRLAALGETVFAETGRYVEPPNSTRVYREAFLAQVAEAVRDWGDRPNGRRCPGMSARGRRARELSREAFPWKGVAMEWAIHFALGLDGKPR